MLSPYCLEIKEENNIKLGVCNKLIPNLIPKNNYIVHYRNLNYYLSKELALKKVHRILEFKQSDWMKPYIVFNTQKEKKRLMKLINPFLNYQIMLHMVKPWKT